jgi:hypothetical protein
MKEYENRTTVFSRLGIDFDLFEGVYASAWEGSCQFLELQRTPLCVGVSASHRLAHAGELSMEDLNGEVLVMPVEGVSDEMDAFRNMIQQNLPALAGVEPEEEDFYKGIAGKLPKTFCSRTVTNIEKAVSMIDRNVNSKIVFCDLVNRMFLSI